METWSLVVLRDLEERFEMVGDGRSRSTVTHERLSGRDGPRGGLTWSNRSRRPWLSPPATSAFLRSKRRALGLPVMACMLVATDDGRCVVDAHRRYVMPTPRPVRPRATHSSSCVAETSCAGSRPEARHHAGAAPAAGSGGRPLCRCPGRPRRRRPGGTSNILPL